MNQVHDASISSLHLISPAPCAAPVAGLAPVGRGTTKAGQENLKRRRAANVLGVSDARIVSYPLSLFLSPLFVLDD